MTGQKFLPYKVRRVSFCVPGESNFVSFICVINKRRYDFIYFAILGKRKRSRNVGKLIATPQETKWRDGIVFQVTT